jgi:hypothetical protein
MTRKTDISEFGEAALALDKEFLEMERLSRELERLENPSEKGLDRCETLLAEVDNCRVRLATQMQTMAQTLEEARLRNEAAERIIAERATMVHERQIEGGKLLERFRALAEMVRQISAAVAPFQHLRADRISDEDKASLASHLPQINEQLDRLVEQAEKLMNDSREANFQAMERNSDSLRQSLQSVRKRLSLLSDFESPSMIH